MARLIPVCDCLRSSQGWNDLWDALKLRLVFQTHSVANRMEWLGLIVQHRWFDCETLVICQTTPRPRNPQPELRKGRLIVEHRLALDDDFEPTAQIQLRGLAG